MCFSSLLTEKLIDLGACEVGYSKPTDAPDALPYAISIAIRLSDAVINDIITEPTYSYFHHYRTVNSFIDRLVLTAGIELERKGYSYLPIAASQTVGGHNTYKGLYSHKKAACLSGLGFIGKSALFISYKYGPRVRLGTLFTDMPLPISEAIYQNSCGSCDLCVKSCPAMAISGNEFDFNNPLSTIFDVAACSTHMKDKYQHIGRGAVCGICIRVCPFGGGKT